MKDKICAVVITYNTGKEYIENFESLKNQVEKIIIIDNGSSEETIQLLKNIKQSNLDKVILKLNENNIGLSKAQNQGIKKGLKLGYEWILLLDDDSKLERNMIKIMLEEYANLNQEIQNKIGIISPNITEKNVKEKSYVLLKEQNQCKKVEIKKDENYLSTYMVIASGSLIKKKCIEKIGFMNEDFFIDSIDTEFCLRLIKFKMKIFLVGKTSLYHSLGDKRKVKFLGKSRVVLNHSAFRKYNIFRNRIKTWKKYYKLEKPYIKFEIKLTIKNFISTILFEDKKLLKLKMIFLGIKDGIKN